MRQYEVSDLGRARKRAAERRFPARVLDDGRLAVRVSLPDGTSAELPLDGLALTAFVRAPRAGERAIHRNGRLDDNRLDNLTWRAPPVAAARATRASHGARVA